MFRRWKKGMGVVLLLTGVLLIALDICAFAEEDSQKYVEDPDISDVKVDEPLYTNLSEEKLISMLAKTVYGEARGLDTFEKSMVVWTILNRYDDGRFGKTIEEVVTKPKQFIGYKDTNPILKEDYDLCQDVLTRWIFEKTAVGEVGRTLPKQYLYFYGDGVHNHFKDENAVQYYMYDTYNPYK